ncbi:hypothetical protein PLICRDRAFT_173464 [Plicaturopsis crispa FD-325 SS-3]|nr:hypothetical protein PLICRDRAFT_173464 [Plicaturopsis crispa FD-325 SS-3]
MFTSKIANTFRKLAPDNPAPPRRPEPPKVVRTSYTSKAVDIPQTFLTELPDDAQPITVAHIDFSRTPLPEYAGSYAVVLENVLSASECAMLLKLAEDSVIGGDGSSDRAALWKPAMVNAGPGREVLITEYRNSDRIIWDDVTLTQRLWARCLQAEGIEAALGTIEGDSAVQEKWAARFGHKWRFTKLNERMRFLKYGPGQYFREHTDGAYQDPVTHERSFYTLHLYLNDSAQTCATDKSLVGGATTFYSDDMSRRLDVDPKAGRVLIFQHKGLLHSGDEVLSGIKYTMRTDLMYADVSKSED